jgi:hypothetical protein
MPRRKSLRPEVIPAWGSTRVRAISEDTAQRLEQADPFVKLQMIERILPPGYVVSSPERETSIENMAVVIEVLTALDHL